MTRLWGGNLMRKDGAAPRLAAVLGASQLAALPGAVPVPAVAGSADRDQPAAPAAKE
ncbi:MAG: hypothetical protein OXI87_24190 [Albidovulum sp.]|nr:hypothetical protein [Albidovulum sp.]